MSLTPSETPSGRAVLVHPHIKRVPLFPLTPSPSPARRPSLSTLEHMDILGELWEAGALLVVKEILSYLSPEELCQGILVSERWNLLINDLKDTIENVQTVTVTPDTLMLRCPLRQLKLFPNFPSPDPSTSLVTPHNIKYSSCPNCLSPAKQLNLRRSWCIACKFDYCQQCFQYWHEEKCEGVGNEDSKKRLRIDIAGTSQARKRLRRL